MIRRFKKLEPSYFILNQTYNCRQINLCFMINRFIFTDDYLSDIIVYKTAGEAMSVCNGRAKARAFARLQN